MRRPSLERGLTRKVWLLGRRIRWYLRRPSAAARNLVVLLDVGPFRRLFRSIYALGLRSVVARLARHESIHCILGHGSWFRGACLHGSSDIDLVIVFRRDAKRSDGVQFPVARTYDSVRWFFPFLGSWDEKEGSLVFLDEVAAGFPAHSTFRIRHASGQFQLLHGEPFPTDLAGPAPTPADWIIEIDRLLRWAIVTGDYFTERLLFWQRTFSKLETAARALGVESTLDMELEGHDSALLDQPARDLYFARANPEEQFARFLGLVRQVMRAVGSDDREVRIRRTTPSNQPPQRRTIAVPAFAATPSVSAALSLPSAPIGLQPRLFYFPVDRPITVVDLDGSAYRGLRQLLERMKRRAEQGDAVIARADGLVFLFSRERDFVDVVPLDPLLCANVHAWIAGSLDFTMPAALHRASVAEADTLFRALRDAYVRHTGHLPKHSSPSIYREDDLDTIRDAFDIMRSWVAHAQGIVLTGSEELVDYLTARHPGARDFLAALMEYRTFLERGRRGRPPANNLYRCLHRFVACVLNGESDIRITDHDSRIGITVGIVTRNRASDLRNALESLTRQERVPDEVVVVDNGSTDETRNVVDGFTDALPLRYLYLAEASIPSARNMVLENATQEVVSFTDDDCAIPPEWLSSVERGFLRADNVGIVGGWVEHWPAEHPTMIDTYYEIFHNHKT